MYIIGTNIQEFVTKKKAKIDEAISQNNFKHAFIIFVMSIPYLKDPELSDFVKYYEEMINRNFAPVSNASSTSR
jgi:hypothetical protein